MDAAVSIEEIRPGSDTAKLLSEQLVELWMKATDEFRRYQRKYIIEREPSPEELKTHVHDLRLMIRLALMMQREVSDPDFGAKGLLPEVEGRLHQLQHVLDMLECPMTDAEADAILAAVFPDAPATGRSA